MRFTRLITKTMRRDPAEAETPSHRYMLKAGMVFQVARGRLLLPPPRLALPPQD